MPRLVVATWNINSVRLRLAQVRHFLRERAPDILCLQETKCQDGSFPHEALRAEGYRDIAIHGQKGYHGVAVLSRLPLAKIERRFFCGKDDARHLSVTVDLGRDFVTVDNLYVPAGGDVPDPGTNPKFAHKLDFLAEMKEAFGRPDGARRILLGDLNVAPLEHDVWSHKQLLDVVSHTPVETEALQAIRAGGDWVDVTRAFVAVPEKVYTWWSYRSPDWAKADKGRRLDHIWVSPDLAPMLAAHDIERGARAWERPSDHVPVVATLEL